MGNRVTGQNGAGSEKKIRAAILGAGYISDFHIRALRTLPYVRLEAICDTSRARAESFQKRWSIPKCFQNAQEMLRTCQLDVVHALVPPPLHAEMASVCLEGGCNVFLEKPAATNIAECERLLSVAQSSKKVVGLNHNAIYHPAFRRLVEEVKNCRLGEVQHVIAVVNVPLRQLQGSNHSFWMLQQPGNIILEQAPHPLSQIQFLVGNAQSVSSMCSGEITLKSGVHFFDRWQISIQCERGTAQFYLSFNKGFFESQLQVIGEDGSAVVDLRRNTIRFSDKTKLLEPVDALRNALVSASKLSRQGIGNFVDYALGFLGVQSPKDPFFMSMQASIAAFYAALRRNEAPPVRLEEGCEIVATCEEIARVAGHAVGVSASRAIP
jgi:predicted dehydrogenase